MAANEDEIRLKLLAETFGYKKAWADVRVQTARDLAQIKASVTNNLSQTRQAAATNLGQTRAAVAQNLAAIRVQTAQQLAAIRANAQRTLTSIRDDVTGFGRGLQTAGRALTVGLTLPLAALAAMSVKAARDIDAQVNTLKAFTGSAEAAEKRLAQLIATSQKTPGLTSNLALTLDAQLRTAQATEEAIDRVLPAIGRLNAVAKLPDAGRFVNNLVQLVTQNFERQDLKELVGQSPLAGQLITEIFNVDSPTNAKAIRASAQKLGINSVDSFFTAFAEAAGRNQGLANVTESLGTQIEKALDRVQFALRPLGFTLLGILIPAVNAVVPLLERLSAAFASLPEGTRLAVVAVGAVIAVAGPLAFALGALVVAASAVGAPFVAAAAVITAAAAALAAAYASNFLGIRDITKTVTGEVSQFIREQFGKVIAWWETNLPLIRKTTETVLNAVRAFWQSNGEQIMAVVRAAWGAIKTTISGTLDVILGIVKLTMQIINKDWDNAWKTFKQTFTDALKTIIFGLAEFEANFLALLGSLANSVIQEAGRIGFNLIDGIIGGIQARSPFLYGMVRELVNGPLAILRGAIGINPFSGKRAKTIGAGGATLEAPIGVGGDASATGFKSGPPPPPGLGGGGSKGKGDSAADKARQEAIRRIEEEQKKIEADYERHKETLSRDYDDLIISSKAYTDGIVEAANERYANLKVSLDKERALQKDESGRERIDNELREAKDERDEAVSKATRERDKREIDALKKHRDALLNLSETYDQARIASIEEHASLGNKTHEAAEEEIYLIQTDAFNRRLEALRNDEARFYAASKDINDVNLEEAQRFSDEIKLVVAEQERNQAAHERRLDEARRNDLQRLREYEAAKKAIQQENENFALELGRREIEAMERRGESRIKIAQAIRENDAIENRIRRQRALDRIGQEEAEALKRIKGVDFEAKKKAAIRALETEREDIGEEEFQRRKRQIEDFYNGESIAATGKYLEEKKAMEDLFAERRLLTEEEFQRRKREIEAQFKKETEGSERGGLFGALIEEWEKFKNALADTTPLKAFADAVAGTFATVKNAAMDGVRAWLLYGQSVGAAIRKALAEHLAGVAAQSGIMALFHAAYAIGSLAFGNFSAAAKHAIAAAKFGALAALAGAGAKLAAGNSFNTGGAGALADSGGGAGVNGDREDNRSRFLREERERNANRWEENRRSEVLQPINLTLNGEVLTTAVVKVIAGGGDDRDRLKVVLA